MGKERANIGIPITGMSCAACASRIEKALSKTAGISGTNVNFATGKATVEYDPSTVNLGELVGVVEDAGYGAEVREASLGVSGMTCASCVARVERALKKIPGVLDATANFATGKASVRYLPGVAEMRDLERAVEDAGYEVIREEEEPAEDAQQREYGELRRRFLVAAVLTALILVGSLPMMLGLRASGPVLSLRPHKERGLQRPFLTVLGDD